MDRVIHFLQDCIWKNCIFILFINILFIPYLGFNRLLEFAKMDFSRHKNSEKMLNVYKMVLPKKSFFQCEF